MQKPPSLVWRPADYRLLGDCQEKLPPWVPGDKCAQAVNGFAGAQAVVFPLAQEQDVDDRQGLTEGLRPMGYAPDGLIAAFDRGNGTGFSCGVRWYPEWQSHQNNFYDALLRMFGAACRKRRVQRVAGGRRTVAVALGESND